MQLSLLSLTPNSGVQPSVTLPLADSGGESSFTNLLGQALGATVKAAMADSGQSLPPKAFSTWRQGEASAAGISQLPDLEGLLAQLAALMASQEGLAEGQDQGPALEIEALNSDTLPLFTDANDDNPMHQWMAQLEQVLQQFEQQDLPEQWQPIQSWLQQVVSRAMPSLESTDLKDQWTQVFRALEQEAGLVAEKGVEEADNTAGIANENPTVNVPGVIDAIAPAAPEAESTLAGLTADPSSMEDGAQVTDEAIGADSFSAMVAEAEASPLVEPGITASSEEENASLESESIAVLPKETITDQAVNPPNPEAPVIAVKPEALVEAPVQKLKANSLERDQTVVPGLDATTDVDLESETQAWVSPLTGAQKLSADGTANSQLGLTQNSTASGQSAGSPTTFLNLGSAQWAGAQVEISQEMPMDSPDLLDMKLEKPELPKLANTKPLEVPIRQPVTSQGFSQVLGERILMMAARQVQVARVRLDPPDMGLLEVKVAVQNDQTQVSFVSQHAAVREVLETSIPRLRTMMEEQGLNLVDVDVSDQEPQQQNAQGDENGDDPVNAPENLQEQEAVDGQTLGLVDHFV